jgi:hypothetical protein
MSNNILTQNDNFTVKRKETPFRSSFCEILGEVKENKLDAVVGRGRKTDLRRWKWEPLFLDQQASSIHPAPPGKVCCYYQ